MTFAAPAKHRRAIAALPAFLDYLAEAQTFANATTSHLLGCAGIATPQMREFLVPVLDYYLARRPDRAGAAE